MLIQLQYDIDASKVFDIYCLKDTNLLRIIIYHVSIVTVVLYINGILMDCFKDYLV
jgi:hypothetical protein